MNEKEYMSGSELRQYLHISTKKMKFIMDNNIITHENTGKVTHRYRVKTEDAVNFKKRMDTDQNFMSEYRGQFSWRKNGRIEQEKRNVEWILAHADKYKKYIEKMWSDIPTAIPSQITAKLIGCNVKSLHRLHSQGKLNSVNVSHVQYCIKEDIINYMISETQVRFNRTDENLKLINGFLAENHQKF